MVKCLRIFISGRIVNAEQKDEFYTAYSTVWLIAPDRVVVTLNHLLYLQLNYASHTQDELKRAYVSCILEMRKDAGFTDTSLDHDNYRLITFGA